MITNKINAIKTLRAMTKSTWDDDGGVFEAKSFVESVDARLVAKHKQAVVALLKSFAPDCADIHATPWVATRLEDIVFAAFKEVTGRDLQRM